MMVVVLLFPFLLYTYYKFIKEDSVFNNKQYIKKGELYMSNYNELQKLSKEQLIELIGIYAKNCLAMDGVWFQSIERKHGMDEAMYHDIEAWWAFTVIETKKIKNFLQLPKQAGLEGLRKVLAIRCYGNINKDETIIEGNT